MHAEGALDGAQNRRIDDLCEEGRPIWERFAREVREERWHPFVGADYDVVREVLMPLRGPGLRFLEWGSATGVITIMADMMGFEAYGIELDETLVEVARGLAECTQSKARFVDGSFIPLGWEWKPGDRDARLGTIGSGRSGYIELERALMDFDVVYAFPWTGEEAMMVDLMRAHGNPEALLVLHDPQIQARIFRNGERVG